MTDEVNAVTAQADQAATEMPAATPSEEQKLAKAKEGGYVEEPAPSRDERVSALIGDVEHAMAHNAPMTPAILAEMKALLQGE